MPGAAIKSNQLTGTALPYSLTMGGQSLLPRLVQLDSIHVHEAGPGAVSTMDFDIWDKTGELTLFDETVGGVTTAQANTPVMFVDERIGVINFNGYLDGWSSRPAFATGRIISVSCVGVESWLDWLVTDVEHDLTGISSFSCSGLLELYLQAIPSPLVSIRNTIGGINSNRVYGGIAAYSHGVEANGPASVVIPAGTPVRRMIEEIVGAYRRPNTSAANGAGVSDSVSVDFYLDVRVWDQNTNSVLYVLDQPYDYRTLTVVDTVAGATASTKLEYQVELGDITHEVYVQGGNAAGSGWFGDGSGIRTRQGFVDEPTCLDADTALQIAKNYLAQFAPDVRGTLTIEDFTPVSDITVAGDTASVHAGSILDLTDAPTGSTGQYLIFSIDKTFNVGGTENWSVAFGGARPSAINLIRKLTRDTNL
jgi:hypothetical protein